MSEVSVSGSVLDDVRHALGHRQTTVPDPLEPFVEAVAENDSDLLARFREEAEALGCSLHVVDSTEAAGKRVVEVCLEAGVKNVVLSVAGLVNELELLPALKRAQLTTSNVSDFREKTKEELVAHLANCAAGISSVYCAVTETGSIVLTSKEEQSLLVSLLPPVHIAVLKSTQIKQSLSQAIEQLHEEMRDPDSPCRSATFITGPSRTSDVELTLSIGVHGPKELHLVIVAA
jgi:L-lactate dehydrogenase complex protein LldG